MSGQSVLTYSNGDNLGTWSNTILLRVVWEVGRGDGCYMGAVACWKINTYGLLNTYVVYSSQDKWNSVKNLSSVCVCVLIPSVKVSVNEYLLSVQW